MLKVLKVIKTEDLKQYQKLAKQKIIFYVSFIIFWIITITMNDKAIDVLHDAMFMTTIICVLGLYFTYFKMKEMLK